MSEQEGRIIRRRRFAQVPDELIIDQAVTDFAVRLWCRLDKYAGDDGRAFPHIDTLATDMRVSASKIKRGLRNLVDSGWITRKRRGFSNIVDTYLNDAPAERDPGPRATVQVTSEGSDLTLPERSDLTLPKKETHSKETQGKARGRRSASKATKAADDLPKIPPKTCPKHANGNPNDAPCRACRDARTAHDQARAARTDQLAKRHSATVKANMDTAERDAVRLPAGELRRRIARLERTG